MTTAIQFTTEYDAVAEAFFNETGDMAPGKDRPAALGALSVKDEERILLAWMIFASGWKAAKQSLA